MRIQPERSRREVNRSGGRLGCVSGRGERGQLDSNTRRAATYVDMESVHKENFHASGGGPGKYLTLAWVVLTGEKSNMYAQIEVAYDCHGKMLAIQQIIYGETKDSAFHSFDNTQFLSLPVCS